MSEWKYSYGMVATLLYLITVLLYECDFSFSGQQLFEYNEIFKNNVS